MGFAKYGLNLFIKKKKVSLVFNASTNTKVVVVVFISSSSSSIDQLEDRRKIETNCGQPKDGSDELFFGGPL